MSEELEQELLWVINHEEVVSTPLKREEIIEIYKEIERLNKDNGDITKLFAKEREETKRLHSIIKEVREYINEDKNCVPKHIKEYFKEILDKVGEK